MRLLPSTEPYSVRECATYMGRTPEWIRQAINDGKAPLGRPGVRVTLAADILPFGDHRRTYRIPHEAFVAFLQAYGWKHLPRLDASTSTSAGDDQMGMQ